jgi:hypothetical protein
VLWCLGSVGVLVAIHIHIHIHVCVLARVHVVVNVGICGRLGDAATVVLELAMLLLFEFSAVLQAAPKLPKANKLRKAVVRRMSVPPTCVVTR